MAGSNAARRSLNGKNRRLACPGRAAMRSIAAQNRTVTSGVSAALAYMKHRVRDDPGAAAHCCALRRVRGKSFHNSRAFENENDDTRRVYSSKISVRVSGGSARWLQFSRSHSRQLTPIGVPWIFSKSRPPA